MVQLPAFPLNPGDTIQISILLEGKGTMKVRGRLDQGTVVELEPERLNRRDFVVVAATGVGVAVAVGVGVGVGVGLPLRRGCG